MWKLHFENDEIIIKGSHEKDSLYAKIKSNPNEPFPDDPINGSLFFLLSTISIIENTCKKMNEGTVTDEETATLKNIIQFIYNISPVERDGD